MIDALWQLAPAAEPWLTPPKKSGLRVAWDYAWDFVTETSGSQWIFYAFAALAVFSALATISRKNVVVAAVWLVVCFCSVAVCYVLLEATFLAAIQVLVYAGAMMVLFVFVIMVLDVDERGATTHRKPSRIGKIGYFGFFGLITLFLIWVFVGTMSRQYVTPGAEITDPEFGTADGVGNQLFRDYLFAFEAVSMLLLAAVVGAVVVARSRRERVKEAQASGLTDAAMHTAGLGPADQPPGAGRPELTDEERRRPHPAMDFGAPSAGGHDGGN